MALPAMRAPASVTMAHFDQAAIPVGTSPPQIAHMEATC
jgi:hypothetical protein